MDTPYVTVSIPRDLVERIKKEVLGKEGLGYRTVAEFVVESTRLRLEEIERKTSVVASQSLPRRSR